MYKRQPLACGCLLGLTLAHTRAHLYRSALESVAYSVNQQIRIMEAHDNVDIDQIFAVGGGVQNPHWMQIVADVTGKEINTPLVLSLIHIFNHPHHVGGIHTFEQLHRIVGALERVAPVSYTHLDVYKRQLNIYTTF